MNSGARKEHALRRAVKRQSMEPRLLGEVLEPLQKVQHPTKQPQSKARIVKAKSKRLAGRTELVGSTIFPFDVSGICEVDLNASLNASRDFSALLRRNGITEVLNGKAVIAPATAPKTAGIETSEAPLLVVRRSSGRVTCRVCHRSFKKLTHTHFQTHGLTAQTYSARFPD